MSDDIERDVIEAVKAVQAGNVPKPAPRGPHDDVTLEPVRESFREFIRLNDKGLTREAK